MPQTARREVAVLYGTRPEAVRLGPVVNELRRRGAYVPRVVTSGRHHAVLGEVHELFGIVPDHDLGSLRRGYSLDDVLIGAVRGFSEYLDTHPVEAVVVQGDSTTAFAGALTAFHRRLPVVHVEAGLRTGDLGAPFPQERNRRFISTIAARHCVPTATAARTLLRERVPGHQVTVTGSTVVDALMHTLSRPVRLSDPAVEWAVRQGRRLVVVVPGCGESWDGGTERVAQALADVAVRFPDVLVVLPVPAGPLVRQVLAPTVLALPNIVLTEALPYAEFVRVLSRATVVVAHPGGVQEEALAFGVPVVVAHGGGVARHPELLDALSALLADSAPHRRTVGALGPSGDGHAASRVVDVIENLVAGRRPKGDAAGPTAPALARCYRP